MTRWQAVGERQYKQERVCLDCSARALDWGRGVREWSEILVARPLEAGPQRIGSVDGAARIVDLLGVQGRVGL